VEDWYKWTSNDASEDLDLTNALSTYINFLKEAVATIVGSGSFQSYLKMDEDLVSNLMKKIDDGKSNIKMN